MVGGLVHGWWLLLTNSSLTSSLTFMTETTYFGFEVFIRVVVLCLSFPMAPISAQKDFYNSRYSKNTTPTSGHIDKMAFCTVGAMYTICPMAPLSAQKKAYSPR